MILATRLTRVPRSSRIPIVALLALLVFAVGASAQTWNEAGDAGSLPANAQVTVGTDPLTTINGNLISDSDVDMYCVTVLTPATFLAQLQCVIIQGPNIWLFDAAGNGVAANSSCVAGAKRVTNTFVLNPGTYYVAVAYNGVDPFSGVDPIWVPANTGERAPDGAGAAGVVTSWLGTGQVQPINPYQILFSSAGFCDMPPVPVEGRTWGRVKATYR